jgi:REP element-mobilizing transposase RayT
MVLSACGEMVRAQLLRSLEVREELEIDTFQIMPNHLHLIVAIKGNATGEVGYARGVLSREAKSVSSFVAGFKAAVTSAIRRAISKNLTVWQRGFFDHIIRTERALMALRQYIMDNPRQWELDKLHPRWPASARDAVDEILESDSKFKR